MKSEYMQCGRCAGNGNIEIVSTRENMLPVPSYRKECPNCDGTGELVCISRKNYDQFVKLIEYKKEAVSTAIDISGLKGVY